VTVSDFLLEYKLEKRIANQWQMIHPWTQSDAIITGEGEVNRLSVLAVGSRIVLLINDLVLTGVEDSSFSQGEIALAVSTYEEANGEIAFDDLDLWDLTEMAVPALPLLPGSTETPATLPTALGDAETLAFIREQETIYSESFSRDRGEWDSSSNELSSRFYKDRAYHMIVHVENRYSGSSISELSVSDFLVEVDARQVDGPLANGYGFLFRYQDGDNFYGFEISSRGNYTLHKRVAGEWEAIIPWSEGSPDAIITGEGETNRVGYWLWVTRSSC
jgi:hypothetical protein